MKTLKLLTLAALLAVATASSGNAQVQAGGYYSSPSYNPYVAQAQYLASQPNLSQVQMASYTGCPDGSCGVIGGGGAGSGGFAGQAFGQQHGPNGSGGCCLPRWFDVQAEWLFWDRDFGDSLALSSQGILGPTVLSTDDLEIKEESGFRLTGAYLVAPATAIEASYFGGFNWASSASVMGNNLFSVFSSFGTDPFNGFPQTAPGTAHNVAFSSSLDNGEVNLRHRFVSANCIFHSSAMVGVRYLRVAEDMIYDTTAPNGSLNYVLQTDNDLVGAQVGTDFSVCVSPRFKIGGDFDAGVYGTHSKQRTDANFSSVNGQVVTNGALAELESASDVAFVGEAGLNASFRVTPRFLLRAGYQVLYVTGIATAVDNFNTESPFSIRSSIINNNGDIFYHGANLGFEFTW